MKEEKARQIKAEERVQAGDYSPLEPFILENEALRLVLLPERGFKIASIYDKARGLECLFQTQGFEPGDWDQPRKLGRLYRPRKKGDDFSRHDRSGLDDCIPTIDPCRLTDPALETFNHGEVWSQAWRLVKSDAMAVTCAVDLFSMPLTLERTVSLEGPEVKLDYRLINRGDRAYPWLWTLHSLLRFSLKARLILPEPFDIINVQNKEVWDFDPRELKNLKADHTYKFYYKGKAPKGPCGIAYPEEGLVLFLHYDQDRFPYLGVWVTTGGYMGEKNLAIEPSNGYYDSLERALENGTGEWLEAGETTTWSMRLEFRAMEGDRSVRSEEGKMS